MANKKRTFSIQLQPTNGPAHLRGLSLFAETGDKCPNCHEGILTKTRDGYIECNECDFSEYDG